MQSSALHAEGRAEQAHAPDRLQRAKLGLLTKAVALPRHVLLSWAAGDARAVGLLCNRTALYSMRVTFLASSATKIREKLALTMFGEGGLLMEAQTDQPNQAAIAAL
ncbi:MAG: hypothetical protein M3R24_42145, partial [Chloroflexota bacterium]|nr:hypothetical protein [Chloroflexota bacterium]